MDNTELRKQLDTLELKVRALESRRKPKDISQEKKPIGAELRALASSLSMHYKTTQRVLLSFSLLAILVICTPFDMNRYNCPRILELACQCVFTNGSESSATLLGVKVQLHLFFPLSLMVLGVLCYNYCHWFSLAFRVGGFFNQRVFEKVYPTPSAGQPEKLESDEIQRRILSNDILHSLYFSTIFRTFAVTKDINYRFFPKFKSRFRNMANNTLVFLPIVTLFATTVYTWRQINLIWYGPIIFTSWLAIVGTDALRKANKKFRDDNVAIDRAKENFKKT